MKTVAYTNLISCQPCKVLHPVLQDLEANNGLEITYKHLAEDRDDFVAAGVMGTPTIVQYDEDGEETLRVSGVKTKNELIKILGL